MKRILIVEDEKALLETLNKYFSSQFETLTASDGQVGLDLALKEKPDLILLDIMLPGINGLEFLERIRKDDWGKNVPIIVLSNLSDMDTELRAKQYGIKDFLTKYNVSIKNLGADIHKILK